MGALGLIVSTSVSAVLTISQPVTNEVSNANSLDLSKYASYQGPSCLTLIQHLQNLFGLLRVKFKAALNNNSFCIIINEFSI